MALIPKIDFNYQTDGFRFTDETGIYSVDDNLGGWSDPNDEYSDVTSAIIKFTNETTLATKTYDVTEDITSLASSQNVITFGPYPSLGDGLYKVEYTIIASATFTDSSCKFFMPDIDCCVDKMIAGLIKECDYSYVKKVLQIEALRMALKKSAYSLNKEKVTYFLNKLKLICNPCANV